MYYYLRIFIFCLYNTLLLFLLISTAYPAATAEKPSDEFLSGYITSVLERDWLWQHNSYKLKVSSGIATISLMKKDMLRQEIAETQLCKINGIKEVLVVITPVDNLIPAGNFLGITGAGKAFPIGDMFHPLIADPKQPQFFISMYQFSSANNQYTEASVGFGETFGLYRFFGIHNGDGIQLNLEGGLFAQFNMSSASHDLINADYMIGIPVTYRYDNNSVRLRIYHQSSHLGDELLLNPNPPERINLSFEAVEILYSRKLYNWRIYGGGEYLLENEPSELKHQLAHWGVEYRGKKTLLWNGRLVSGVDMKAFEEHNWSTDISIKTGLEFGQPNPGQRRLRVMLEWYKGFNPRGQFYINKVEYYGLGVSLGF